MKELKLFQKEIEIPGREDPVKTSSAEMFRVALEGSETNRRGLVRIGQILKILDKIQKVEDEKAEILNLEDAEFNIVYESVDKFEWLPLALRFKEFFEEMERVKKVN